MYLGKRLKQKRKEKKLTQEELGSLLGVTKVSICNWEKGLKRPSSKNLIELSKALNVSVEYLIGTDFYVVAEEEDAYRVVMAKEEIDFMKELKKNKRVYLFLLANPKRAIDVIEKNML